MATDGLSPEQKEMISNLHKSCVAETSVSEELIAAAAKGNFAEDKPLKCYMKCLLTSIGVMEEDGSMDFDAYMEMLPPQYKKWGEKVEAKCKDVAPPEGDACETAFKINKCSYEADPEVSKLKHHSFNDLLRFV
ncbi:hypothetical protein V9T40_000552 [Parthenolecanium corni]|uniref:Uncharacterized protein n=1 Tax=Parthenolecanium corni TaxID=536013 RepID=A0AAN9T9J3_9HEMI